MRGYPFGTFLFWRVEAAHSKDYKFYGFARDYHERDNPHCPDLGPITDRELIAVLDGQQRLTALNIGLRGSLAIKRLNMWRTNPLAYPKRHLYLNLLGSGEPNDEGEAFAFAFLDPIDLSLNVDLNLNSENELWFRVSDILGLPDHPSDWRGSTSGKSKGTPRPELSMFWNTYSM